MKQRITFLTLITLCVGVITTTLAAEGEKSWQINNRLRFEYDDNIRQQEADEDSSFKIIEEIDFLVNLNLENTFVSIHYKPSFVWWDNRPDEEEGDIDFHSSFDFILNQRFNPRMSLSLKDTLRITQLSEIIERGASLRPENDYVYNALNGSVQYLVTPDSRLDVEGRHIMLTYDSDDLSDTEDFDIFAAGLTLRQTLNRQTTVSGQLRAEQIDYDSEVDRGSDTYQLGGGIEQTFSPNLLGSARLGYTIKEFNEAQTDSSEEPYGDLSLSFLPSPATRMNLGLGYSFFEASVFPYANQVRSRVMFSVAHDITAKISLYVSAGLTKSEYKAEEAVPTKDGGEVTLDGDENITQVSARTTYQVNRSNWIEAGWQFTQLDSDEQLREDFTRNRVHIGWKTNI